MKQKVKQNQLKQTAVRIPLTLFKVIENRAKKRLRSVNNELLMLAKMGLSNPLGEDEALKAAEEMIARERGTNSDKQGLSNLSQRK